MVLMAIELHSSRAFRDSYRRTSQQVEPLACALCPVSCAPIADAAGESSEPVYKLISPHRVTVLPRYVIGYTLNTLVYAFHIRKRPPFLKTLSRALRTCSQLRTPYTNTSLKLTRPGCGAYRNAGVVGSGGGRGAKVAHVTLAVPGAISVRAREGERDEATVGAAAAARHTVGQAVDA